MGSLPLQKDLVRPLNSQRLFVYCKHKAVKNNDYRNLRQSGNNSYIRRNDKITVITQHTTKGDLPNSCRRKYGPMNVQRTEPHGIKQKGSSDGILNMATERESS